MEIMVVMLGFALFLIVGGRVAMRRWEGTLEDLHRGTRRGAEPVPGPNITAFGSAWSNSNS